MGPRPLFVVFGIPVSFDPFFIFGAALVASWAPPGEEVHFVVAMLVFTVIHEFGHALTAKAFGARPYVVIRFLGGYTADGRSSTTTTRQSLLISLMGPLTELLVGIGVAYFAYQRVLGARSFDELRTWTSVLDAVMWAGILLAFINLLPFLPLDGGRILETLAERIGGRSAANLVVRFSFAMGAVMLLGFLARPGS